MSTSSKSSSSKSSESKSSESSSSTSSLQKSSSSTSSQSGFCNCKIYRTIYTDGINTWTILFYLRGVKREYTIGETCEDISVVIESTLSGISIFIYSEDGELIAEGEGLEFGEPIDLDGKVIGYAVVTGPDAYFDTGRTIASCISWRSSESIASTSSADDIIIRVPLITQSHHNLLPFSWIGEAGYPLDLGDNSKINFTVESANAPYLNYEAVINRDNSYLSANTSSNGLTYVPQDPDSLYQHRSSFYVDVIAKDISGIKEVRTHVEPNAYEFEDIENSFVIPKFSWEFSNVAAGSNSAAVTTGGTFWVTTSDKIISQLRYSKTTTENVYNNKLDSDVNRVVFADDSSKMYVSTNDSLYIYLSSDYQNEMEKSLVLQIDNDDRGIIDLYDTNWVWTVQAYKGNVLKQDSSTLVTSKIYAGMDAPQKIVKSDYHNAYFVMASHILWKIDDVAETNKAVYEINEYEMKDLAILESGEICLLLHGETEDIIRVLDNDLYAFLLDERIQGENVRFCKACNEGKFYILTEINNEQYVYTSYSYVYDVRSNIFEKIDSEIEAPGTTTTTTLPAATNPIQILSPIANESIKLNSEYEIKWASSKSIADPIKIELYKGGVFNSSIIETTNTGIYSWTIPKDIKEDTDYSIKITWVSASSDPLNSDMSDEFELAISPTTTTTTTTKVYTENVIGIDYDPGNNYILVMLRSGLVSVFDMNDYSMGSLIESGVINPISMTIKNAETEYITKQTKVRIWVGSQENYSDLWDSGEIITGLTSMYYSGGNNLIPGRKYYVNIQTYTEDLGWSDVQTRSFVMPR